MAIKIQMKHPGTGEEAVAYEGYSWTCFFFGALPALLRGDIQPGLAVLGLCAIASIGAVMVGLPTWLATGVIGGHLGLLLQRHSPGPFAQERLRGGIRTHASRR